MLLHILRIIIKEILDPDRIHNRPSINRIKFALAHVVHEFRSMNIFECRLSGIIVLHNFPDLVRQLSIGRMRHIFDDHSAFRPFIFIRYYLQIDIRDHALQEFRRHDSTVVHRDLDRLSP